MIFPTASAISHNETFTVEDHSGLVRTFAFSKHLFEVGAELGDISENHILINLDQFDTGADIATKVANVLDDQSMEEGHTFHLVVPPELSDLEFDFEIGITDPLNQVMDTVPIRYTETLYETEAAPGTNQLAGIIENAFNGVQPGFTVTGMGTAAQPWEVD